MYVTGTQAQKAKLNAVASSASAVQIFAPNDGASPPPNSVATLAASRGRTILNDSSAVLTLVFGSPADLATNKTVILAAGAYYEVPFQYTGEVSGQWASANGFARTTEVY